MADENPVELPFILQPVKDVLVVEFRAPSLMDQLVLERAGQRLYQLTDVEHKKKLILDFTAVNFVSSQAIGIVMNLHKKSAAIGGKMILCGCGPRLQELIKITRLDRVLNVKPTQKEAMNAFAL